MSKSCKIFQYLKVLPAFLVCAFFYACSGAPHAGTTESASAPDVSGGAMVRMPVSVFYLVSGTANQAQKITARNMADGEFTLLVGVDYKKTAQDCTWNQKAGIRISGSRESVAGTVSGWSVVEVQGTALIPRLPAADSSFSIELGIDELVQGAQDTGFILLSKKLLSKARTMLHPGSGVLYLKDLSWVESGKYFVAAFAVKSW